MYIVLQSAITLYVYMVCFVRKSGKQTGISKLKAILFSSKINSDCNDLKHVRQRDYMYRDSVPLLLGSKPMELTVI